jgi:hypothetical protein
MPVSEITAAVGRTHSRTPEWGDSYPVVTPDGRAGAKDGPTLAQCRSPEAIGVRGPPGPSYTEPS